MKISLVALATVLLGLMGFLVYDEAFRAEAVDVVIDAIPALAPEPVTIIFTGDVMFDRGVRRHAAAYGDDSLFAGIKETLIDSDAVVVNLETTLTDKPSVASKDSSRLEFTSDPRFADLLASLNVDVATLSNNHTDDFGRDGLLETKTHLALANIGYHGSPHNIDTEFSVETNIGRIRACFVGYQGFIAPDPSPVAKEIMRLSPRCDYLVATMHAGDEYVYLANAVQTRAARAFIDAGADVVIGTHPHVVQPLEIYQGKPIFYSLGNFMFDQDFSWETTHALLVRASVGEDEVRYEVIPVSVIKAEAALEREDTSHARLIRMLIGPGTPPTISEEILSTGSFTLQSHAILPE